MATFSRAEFRKSLPANGFVLIEGEKYGLMAKAKVPLTVAQKRMRHSNPSLTANVYTVLTDAELIQPEYRIGANLGNKPFVQKRKAE